MATLAKIHAVCRKLPGTTFDIKWGKDECYSVGGKMYAVIGPHGVGFKVDDNRFLELTDVKGIIPAPYMAKHKWVLVEDLKALSDAEAAELIKRSHALIVAKLPKKAQLALKA